MSNQFERRLPALAFLFFVIRGRMPTNGSRGRTRID
jgi:hypothetical protein